MNHPIPPSRTTARTASRTAVALAVAVAAAGLLLGACGSSSSSATGGSAGSTTSAVPATPTSAATVSIKDYAFNPKTITVTVGGTVTWTNHDQFAHAIADQKSGQDGSHDIAPGTSYRHTYTTPGTYPYVCGIHPNMKGTVVVR